MSSNVVLGQIALAHNERALFAGTAEPNRPGCVRVYRFPLTGDFLEYQVGWDFDRVVVSSYLFQSFNHFGFVAIFLSVTVVR